MRGDLPKREPGMLADWEKAAATRRSSSTRPARRMRSCCTTARRTRTARSTRPRGQQDPQGHGGQVEAAGRLPLAVRAGLGLPRPADRNRGREEASARSGRKLDARAFRAKCREYAPKQIDLQRADFKRLGVLGEWENPYRTMDFKYEADMIRALAKIIANGHVVRGVKPVHWCFDCGSALAEAEIEYQDKQLAGGRRRVRRGRSEGAGGEVRRRCGRRDRRRADLDHHAMDAAGKPRGDAGRRTRIRAGRRAVARRQARAARVRRSAGRARRSRVMASKTPRARPRAGRGRSEGARRLQHPFYARECRCMLGDHVSAEDGTGAVHTAPGHGVEDFAVGQKYGLSSNTLPN